MGHSSDGKATRSGVVAAGDPHTARAGAEILTVGGNAVDAAVGATCAAFAAEPVSTAPFGGGFAVVGTQVLVHHLLRGLSLEEAVNAPRIHYEGGPLYLDKRGPGAAMSTSAIHALAKRVPEPVLFDAPNIFFGGVHAAGVGGHGAGDPRRGGAVARSRDISPNWA